MSEIIVNVLSTVIAAMILGASGILIQRLKQRARPPQIPDYLKETEAYKNVLAQRRSDRGTGCVMTVSCIFYVVLGVSVKLNWNVTTLFLPALLLVAAFLSSYMGYMSISSQEIEQQRQQKRRIILREAQGSTPYGYIMENIAYPVLAFFYTILAAIIIILLPTIHLWILFISVTVAIPLILVMRNEIIAIHQGISYLKHVPEERRKELQQELKQGELEGD